MLSLLLRRRVKVYVLEVSLGYRVCFSGLTRGRVELLRSGQAQEEEVLGCCCSFARRFG